MAKKRLKTVKTPAKVEEMPLGTFVYTTPHVVRIEGNLKGARSAVDLGLRTLIVGPNGSGKSRCAGLIEFAATGTVADVAGRETVAVGTQLMSLCPPGEASLWSKITLSDGRTLSASCTGDVAKASKVERTGDGAVELPLRDIRAALTAKPENARSFFLPLVLGDLAVADVEAILLESRRGTWNQAAGTSGVIDRLLAARELAATAARKHKAEAAAAENLLNAQGAVSSPVSEGDFAQAQAAVDAAADDLGEAMRGQVAEVAEEAPSDPRSDKDILAQEFPELRQAILDAKANVALAEQWLADNPLLEADSDTETRVQRANAFLRVIDRLREIHADKCGVCDGPTTDQALAAKRAAILSSVQSLVAASAAREERLRARGESNAKRNAWRLRVDDLASLARTKIALVRNQAQRAPQIVVNEEAVRAAREELDAANDRLTALHAQKHAWKIVSDTRSAIDLSRKAADDAARDLEALDDVIRALFERGTAAFVARVQSFLPPTDTFALSIREGNRDVFRFGLVRDGKLHSGLSGAEWARITVALAAAASTTPSGGRAVEGREAHVSTRVIIPEERAFDPVTLARVMEALSAEPCTAQVILTSPVKPSRVPKGWTVVDLGDTANNGTAHKNDALELTL